DPVKLHTYINTQTKRQSSVLRYDTQHKTYTQLGTGPVAKSIRTKISHKLKFNLPNSKDRPHMQHNAGLDGTRVKLALEPEAASIWCEALDVDIQHKMAGIGTQYMVIDLGGGTADISAHEKNDDGTLKEIHKASGGPWGGIYVDDNYLKFLEQILGEKVITELRTKEMTDFFDLISEFETKKRNFKSTSKDKVTFRICTSTRSLCKQITGQEFEERLAASKYSNSVIVNGGDKLRVEPDIVKDWFNGPINNLVDHLKSILKEPKLKTVQTIVVDVPIDFQITQEFIPTAYKTTSPIYRTTAENPVYVTDPGCELLGKLELELPRDIPLSELDHDITFLFGGTELVETLIAIKAH
ncbi:HS12A-like protein, partial [Mya arenaria]